ncbi:MAG TPA: S8 family serine peptidase [Tepidisphaeraceae bacterium]|nr:S8 family serine peptidase [Tepidisphaeraceae bacterium]
MSAAVDPLFDRVLTTFDYGGQTVTAVKDHYIVTLRAPGADSEGRGLVEDLPVRFIGPGTDRAQKQAMLDGLKAGLRYTQNLGVSNAFELVAPAGTTFTVLREKLRGLADFVNVEPVTIGEFTATTPNDPSFSSQWHHKQVSDKDVDSDEAWDYTTGWAGAAVAVLDSGVDLQHTDIDGNLWINAGEIAGNGIDDDGNGYTDDYNGYNFYTADGTLARNPDDVFGHGTPVAGVIAAEGNNNNAVAGVSWRNKVIPVRIGGTAPDASAVINGINYVSSLRQNLGVNVRVLNMSFTIPSSTGLSNAIATAESLGLLVVAAAGNSGLNINPGANPVYPASYTNDNIIAVAATDQSDALASFSNYGSTAVDIAAPGVDIVTLANGGGTATVSGTSFAAPIVAGAAALLFAMKPDATVAQVKSAIMDNDDNVAGLSGLVVSGGRLNIHKAVQSLSTGASKVFIGDSNTFPIADDVYIRRKPGDVNTTQILQWQSGSYAVYAELPNQTSKRIDVYTLGANDAVTVEANVNNKIYVGTSEGADTVNASQATYNVTMFGEAGNDTLRGGAGDDIIEGGSGNDVIYGGAGANYILGGGGNDTIYARYGSADSVYGGSGTDSGERDSVESVWAEIEILL